MTRMLVVLVLTVLSVPAWALSIRDVPNPRKQGVWVSDTANLISSNDEDAINQMIDEIHLSEGVEIAVVTVDVVSTPTPKDFATSLFNYWGIGQKGVDNGLLVLMVKGERRLEMETGYGLEPVLTDGWLKNMQQSQMIPSFKRGEFGVGLRKGVRASIDRIQGSDADFSAPNPLLTAEDGGQPPLFWLLGLGGLGLAFGGGREIKRRRDRSCPECKTRLSMVPDDEDDEHLTAGQQTEEMVGSIDYELLYCESCAFTKMLVNKRWFSGYASCPSCAHRTARTSSTTVRHATTMSTGLEEITTICAHCNHESTHRRTIPRVVQTSSSSSSSGGGFSGGGGGGFSGGSSGGGGAGSSW